MFFINSGSKREYFWNIEYALLHLLIVVAILMISMSKNAKGALIRKQDKIFFSISVAVHEFLTLYHFLETLIRKIDEWLTSKVESVFQHGFSSISRITTNSENLFIELVCVSCDYCHCNFLHFFIKPSIKNTDRFLLNYITNNY